MKIALIQMSAGADKAVNVAKASGFIRRAAAKKARLVVLPEVFNFRGDLRDRQVLSHAAEAMHGPTVKAMAALAREHGIFIIIGSLIEQGPQGKCYNTMVVLDPAGRMAAKYRKIHLFDAKLGDKIIRESACFAAGKKTQTIDIEGFRAGLSICYDLRFADLYAAYRKAAVDMLLVPACFTKKTGQAHWEVLLRARAIETLAYVIAPNQVGSDHRGVETFGNSMIIDPWGEVIARGSGSKEEIIYGTIAREAIIKARTALPGIVQSLQKEQHG